jgi:hypothetical protein
MIVVKEQKLFLELYYLTNETTWSWVFLRSYQSLSYPRISQNVMISEYWLPCSPEPHTGPGPERYESSPYYSSLFMSDHFNMWHAASKPEVCSRKSTAETSVARQRLAETRFRGSKYAGMNRDPEFERLETSPRFRAQWEIRYPEGVQYVCCYIQL